MKEEEKVGHFVVFDLVAVVWIHAVVELKQ
jgi:hypothetical protein